MPCARARSTLKPIVSNGIYKKVGVSRQISPRGRECSNLSRSTTDSLGPFLMYLLSFAEYVVAIYLADVFEAGFYELAGFFGDGGNL